MKLISQPTRRRPSFHPLTVSRVEPLTPDAVAISFTVPEALSQAFAFEAGQHVTLRASFFGEDVRRSYSCCISPAQARQRGEIRVASARVPDGIMSNWLNDEVQVGDVLQVMSPLGSFTCPVEPESSRHHVAVAAGSGITPVLSIISTVLEEEAESRVTLFFGNRRTDTIMFLEELMDLKNAYPQRFSLINVLSAEPQEVDLFNGRIDRGKFEHFLDTLVPVERVDEWYLCGPFGMVETLREVLGEHEADSAHVHHEVFHVDEAESPALPRRRRRAEATPVAPAAIATVTLGGRTTKVPIRSAAQTILSATLQQRPEAPFSCTNGVCGTCRAKVVSGEVRMDRNYALEEDEVAAGYALMCQSHPVTQEVVVDYDA